MNAGMKNHYLLSVLVAALSLIPTSRATAQTFTTLYSFTNGSDGARPVSLVLSGNTLYGTAESGGTGRGGTVFKVNTDGTGFATVYCFTNGSDGTGPGVGLTLSGNTLYGTSQGGTGSNGTVFEVNTDSTGFATLYSFTNGSDGAGPSGGLTLSGDTLYGTTVLGGTVFKVNTDGTGFAALYRLTGVGEMGAGVILSGKTLYGTMLEGGTAGLGALFEVNTDSTGFATLYNFTGGSYGAWPNAVILSGDTFYGTETEADAVFKVNADGTGFATVYSFTELSGTSGLFGNGTNSDGANPNAGLIVSGNTLYGTAEEGGPSGYGTMFKVNTDGTGFATLYGFTNGSDGDFPLAGLILSGNTLYGTASGGTAGYGTVFSLSLPVSAPHLAIIQSGTNVVLSWPANFTGFTLQSTTNLVSPAIWTPVAPAPVVVNGQNTVATPISGTQQFYRLSQ
jgi:uncharacterized repeat protein (TIGR03803 family)